MERNLKENNHIHKIRVAILADEPLGWYSGKHFFTLILDNYSWKIKDHTYKFIANYIFDKDIIKGKLNTSNYDVLLVPGGGVGDAESVMKGFKFLRSVKKWRKNISTFIQNGGGIVGICGGTALITGLKTGNEKSRTFLEKQYDKSSLGISCVKSYYKDLAPPLFYPFQKLYPEKIGASSYVFSFAPGETKDGKRIHTGGVPVDFTISKDTPVFRDCTEDLIKVRWWGGPALIVPKKPDREVKTLAYYPVQDLSENESTKIHAWRYTGGIIGIFFAFITAMKIVKKEKMRLNNVLLYTFLLAGNWELTDKIIDLDFSKKPSITAEIYPNENKGRILLCTSHPEYMIWYNGHIEENKETNFNCLATGLHKWKQISPLSDTATKELTHSWWMIRRFVAWAAKIPDDHFPPIDIEKNTDKIKSIISENVFWDGSLLNLIKNI